ncbi:hypothetical protein ACFFUB_11560 [Algimonas porphyrae]|nr:hypothetical protein [Algimonas porphyrae]
MANLGLAAAAPALLDYCEHLEARLADAEARAEMFQAALDELVGSPDHEFSGVGADGLSHLRDMYREKWDMLGPSCRTSLRNHIDMAVRTAAAQARRALKDGEG